MKSFSFFSALVLIAAVITLTSWNTDHAAYSLSGGGPKIVFKEYVFDFGIIKRHADGTCKFVFTNKGDAPLMITKVSASCGCTVPSYPKAPVLPGQSDIVSVKYNTKIIGVFTKTINVSTNDPENRTVVLTIKGTVTK